MCPENTRPNFIEVYNLLHCNFHFFAEDVGEFVWLKKICPLGTVFIIKENWRGISTLHSLAPLLHLLPTFFSELEGENRMRKDDQANFQIRFLVSFSFFYIPQSQFKHEIDILESDFDEILFRIGLKSRFV